jgi:hypothetical protein
MSLFRKQTPVAVPTLAPEPAPAPVAGERETSSTRSPAKAEAPLYSGSQVDIASIYRSGTIGADELDRVARAEELLHHLPSKATNTREVVDATLRAFGVDRGRIVEAASKQLDALEAFIRFSQAQTQQVLDTAARRIAELEVEIERCKANAAQATNEGEDRAKAVNNEMQKVQRVLEFFGDESDQSSNVIVDNAGSKPPRTPSP